MTPWTLDAQGWLQGSGPVSSGPDAALRPALRPADAAPGRVRIVPSPNFDARPEAAALSLLVVHNISLPPGRFGTGDIAALFANTLDFDADPFYAEIRGLRVSSHFLIERDGAVVQFVSTLDRAWHAGVSAFDGRTRCNDFAIGIELEGTDTVAFEPAQYAALATLTEALRGRHPITAVAGHSDIAPGRKTDPGPCFDWATYATLAHLPARMLPFQTLP